MAMAHDTAQLEQLYTRHVDMLYRVCFTYMKNPGDTEDAVQDTFMKYIRSHPSLGGAEHEKAWLIRAAVNVCKDALRRHSRKNEPLEDDLPGGRRAEPGDLREAVLALPEKYKAVVYLFYYEGYASEEIARMLRKPGSTVRNHLSEARRILKTQLGGDLE